MKCFPYKQNIFIAKPIENSIKGTSLQTIKIWNSKLFPQGLAVKSLSACLCTYKYSCLPMQLQNLQLPSAVHVQNSQFNFQTRSVKVYLPACLWSSRILVACLCSSRIIAACLDAAIELQLPAARHFPNSQFNFPTRSFHNFAALIYFLVVEP